MSNKTLSAWLSGKARLTDAQTKRVLLELATRLEIVELERFEDIDETLEVLCTCFERDPEQEHEEDCPQYRNNT